MSGQGADERRIAQLLRARGVGPDATLPPPPPPPDDWWDRLYDDRQARPDGPRPAAPRLPDWRKGKLADLRGPDPDSPDTPAKPTRKPDADEPEDDVEPDGEWADLDDEPEAAPPTVRRPQSSRQANRRAAHAAYLGLPGRTRWFLYTGSAAAAGYVVGLVPLMNGWIASCGHDTSPRAALILGLGIATAAAVLIDQRTRRWWGPLPWLCRIPLASAVLALLLYAPGATS